MGYDVEVAMIKEAKKLGLLTTPYCFNPNEAERMAEVGADVIVGENIYIHHPNYDS
jgi:predicted TIM-barrel enzyme